MLIEHGPGWNKHTQPLIDMANAKGVKILQIKEKFGGLRFYTDSPVDEEFRAAKKVAEDACDVTCDMCGEPGVLRKDGWMRVRCDGHVGGHHAKESW